MKWYLMVIKNYAGFSGRARRKEYWIYGLFQMMFLIVAAILDNILGLTFAMAPYGFFYSALALATLIPGLAVTIRRLHDTNRSGWWLLIGLIPIIGAIWLLVLVCLDSDAGENKYGPNPKGVTSFSGDALDSHMAS